MALAQRRQRRAEAVRENYGSFQMDQNRGSIELTMHISPLLFEYDSERRQSAGL
jgi:hypothetical protein